MRNNFNGRHIISIKDITKNDIFKILEHSKKLKENPNPNLLNNHTMGSCFFEPSTRTRLSFETAMERLGGKVAGFADPAVTSSKKGETLYDTIKIISQYVDVIVMRHPFEGAARLASEASSKPIINGGDGANQHPTQTMLDLFTINECQERLEKIEIAMVGDLKYGRTVHSLAEALAHFNAKMYFVAPDSLQMPDYICKKLRQNNIEFSLHKKIEEVVNKVDILYMTRIQAERFPDQTDYEKLKNIYVLNSKMLENVRDTMKILHPLPRVNEITTDVDRTKHAYYFEQAQNGLYVRQAVLGLVLGKLE